MPTRDYLLLAWLSSFIPLSGPSAKLNPVPIIIIYGRDRAAGNLVRVLTRTRVRFGMFGRTLRVNATFRLKNTGRKYSGGEKNLYNSTTPDVYKKKLVKCIYLPENNLQLYNFISKTIIYDIENKNMLNCLYFKI